jgi:hyaluronan synthase
MDPAIWVLRIVWTLFFGVFVLGVLAAGYYFAPVFFRAGNFALGFYGSVVFGKLFYDGFRARRNKTKVARRMAHAKREMDAGKYNPVVGIQQVGRAEPPKVHYWAFKWTQQFTYAYKSYLYVYDGNGRNRDFDINDPDPVIRKLATAFANAPNGAPPADGVQPGVTTVLGRIRAAFSRAFFWVWYGFLDLLFWILTRPPAIVNAVLVAIGWIVGSIVPSRKQQGFIPIPTDIPEEWNFRKVQKGDATFVAEIGMRTFGVEDTDVFWVDFVLSEARTLDQLRQTNWLYNAVRDSTARHIFIFQPPRSKREAIFTASRLLIRSVKAEKIFFTDSDTVIEPQSLMNMVLASYSYPRERRMGRKIGAVTGDVRIFNVDNWLSLMSSLRYWFAFNLERASQSAGGYVTCISGPLGLYDAEDLAEILVEWLNHEFMGRPCTFGEDRDLSNRILKLGNGHQILFVPGNAGVDGLFGAIAWTDTPTSIRIWLRQQIRWNKSYYREFIENLFSLYLHGPYLSVDLLYQVTFPVFLALSLGGLITAAVSTGDWSYAATWALTIMGGGFIRAFYAIIVEWNAPLDPQGRSQWKFLLFFGYGFLYIGFLLVARLYALVTIWVTNWGTPTDRSGKQIGAATLSA